MAQPPDASSREKFASQLDDLPPELIHIVLGLISIQRLLELICSYDVPNIEACICTHTDLCKLFQPDALGNIKVAFKCYWRLRSFHLEDPSLLLSGLFVGPAEYCAVYQNELPSALENAIKEGIRNESDKYNEFLDVLKFYLPINANISDLDNWIGSSPARNRLPLMAPGRSLPRLRRAHAIRSGCEDSDWRAWSLPKTVRMANILDAAEAKLNNAKAAQLKAMATLIEDYPGMLRLRDDRSQQPMEDEEDVVDTLLLTARRMTEDRHLGIYEAEGVEIFSSSYLFICPVDRSLQLFLKTIERFPPDVEFPNNEPENVHSYPEAMKVVLQGLNLVYPQVSDNEEWAGTFEATAFKRIADTERTKFADLTLGAGERAGLDGVLPASEKEVEWLTAYLEICEYMMGMQETWEVGQTVGEYWCSEFGFSPA